MAMIQPAKIPKDKEFIKFCNSLRCPLCGSQLDGNIHPKGAKLYCANNNDEYNCELIPGSKALSYEKISYWYTQYQYDIINSYRRFDDSYHAIIYRLNLDNIPYYRVREKIFEVNGPKLTFFRKRMEEEVFLNKLKLYNVFS